MNTNIENEPSSGETIKNETVHTLVDNRNDERPSIKWGLVVWGFVFLAGAIVTMNFTFSGIEELWHWMVAIDPTQFLIGVIIIIGSFVFLFGLIGLLKHSKKPQLPVGASPQHTATSDSLPLQPNR